MTMADLTPDRLAELRRIATEITMGTYEWRIIETGLALLDCIEALEQELDAARSEAERWKQQYEALWAGVERVIQDLRAAFREAFATPSPYHDGAAEAYYKAEQMVRRVLGEAGGGR